MRHNALRAADGDRHGDRSPLKRAVRLRPAGSGLSAFLNPERDWFGDEELAAIGGTLGHPVKQVRAHI
ncbi:hypothetical protein [Streptomyces sp. NPDC001076]